jgi:hypothetical protein
MDSLSAFGGTGFAGGFLYLLKKLFRILKGGSEPLAIYWKNSKIFTKKNK